MRGLRALPWFLLASLVLVFSSAAAFADDLPRVKPEAAGLSADKLKRIDDVFAKAVEDKQVAGSVVLILRSGKVAYLKSTGMANIDDKKTMKPDSIFRLMSMTKAVTSVAAMILVDEGKLKLDDPVANYLPEFKDQKVLVAGKGDKEDDYSLVAAERPITVRDLLRHTSGLIYSSFTGGKQLSALYNKSKINGGFLPTKEKLADNVKRLGKLPLAHQPGTAFTYGLSTDVLGRVVEVASGKELDEFFRERIFKPLEMKDTSFLPPADKSDRVVVNYTLKDKKLVPNKDFMYEGSKNYFSGGAGLFGTANDYGRFCQMLLNGGKLGKATILKPETVTQMTKNQLGKATIALGPHGDAFGLGFGIVTPKAKGKTPMSAGAYGWGGAFYTYFWIDPSKELVGVMMTQILPANHLKLREELTKLTYEALMERAEDKGFGQGLPLGSR
jgi:CubicO group peptidase (beta-lactamase class C family)